MIFKSKNDFEQNLSLFLRQYHIQKYEKYLLSQSIFVYKCHLFTKFLPSNPFHVVHRTMYHLLTPSSLLTCVWTRKLYLTAQIWEIALIRGYMENFKMVKFDHARRQRVKYPKLACAKIAILHPAAFRGLDMCENQFFWPDQSIGFTTSMV